ncbi:hypothetical protein COP2_031685 [Malus domestica]
MFVRPGTGSNLRIWKRRGRRPGCKGRSRGRRCCERGDEVGDDERIKIEAVLDSKNDEEPIIVNGRLRSYLDVVERN